MWKMDNIISVIDPFNICSGNADILCSTRNLDLMETVADLTLAFAQAATEKGIPGIRTQVDEIQAIRRTFDPQKLAISIQDSNARLLPLEVARAYVDGEDSVKRLTGRIQRAQAGTDFLSACGAFIALQGTMQQSGQVLLKELRTTLVRAETLLRAERAAHEAGEEYWNTAVIPEIREHLIPAYR
jgi:hypothetical protein